MDFAFYDAVGFHGRGLEDWDVSSVVSMNGVFFATHLEEDLSSWDVSSVTHMGEGMLCGSFQETTYLHIVAFAHTCCMNGEMLSQWNMSSVRFP